MLVHNMHTYKKSRGGGGGGGRGGREENKVNIHKLAIFCVYQRTVKQSAVSFVRQWELLPLHGLLCVSLCFWSFCPPLYSV